MLRAPCSTDDATCVNAEVAFCCPAFAAPLAPANGVYAGTPLWLGTH